MDIEVQKTGSSLHVRSASDVPLDQAARHLRDMDERLLVYVALTDGKDGGILRLAELPASHEIDTHVPLQDRDATVGLVLPVGDDLIVSGSQRLLTFLNRPEDLLLFGEVASTLADPGRYVGRLACSIGRFAGRWQALTGPEQGHIVIGADDRTGRLYAIRMGADGTQQGLCYADPRDGQAPTWRWFGRAPDLCRAILDASRFTRTEGPKGRELLTTVIHLRDQHDRYENRLLRIDDAGDEPTLMWSEPFTGTYRVLRDDWRGSLVGRETQATGLLLEDQHADTHVVHRLPLQQCHPQQLYIYFLGFRG